MSQQEKTGSLPAFDESRDGASQRERSSEMKGPKQQNSGLSHAGSVLTKIWQSMRVPSQKKTVNVYAQSFTKDQMKALIGWVLEDMDEDLDLLESYREVTQ